MSQPAFIGYPPRWHNVLLPRHPLSAMLDGMTLYGPSRPRAIALQRGLLMCAVLTRGRLLPGTSRREWNPPMDASTWQALTAQWSAAAGGSADGYAVHTRVQDDRSGFTVFVCARRRSLVVRLSPHEVQDPVEQRISDAAAAVRPSSFRVPRIRASGEADGWRWIASEAISNRPHRPASRAPAELFGEATRLVESVLDRPAAAPAHWRGAHRDLTPWNLRRARRDLWLIDWQDCGWAPPHADLVYFRATRAALAGHTRLPLTWEPKLHEAVDHWVREVSARTAAPTEARLRERTLAALDAGGVPA